MGNPVIDFNKMQVGKKGGGKHWTKEEIKKREAAARKLKPKVKVDLRMPDWLDDEAAKVWNKTIEDMKQYEILEKIDEDVLATYCDAVAKYKELTGMIAEKGYTSYTATGSLTISPYVKGQQSYARIMMQYADKLGLNANSRARLAKKIADEEDDENANLFD